MPSDNKIFLKDFAAVGTPGALLKGELDLQYNAISTQINGSIEELKGERSDTIHGTNTSGHLSPVVDATRKRDWAEHALIKNSPLSTVNRASEIDHGFMQMDASIT